MENCKVNIEKISAMLDGELSPLEEAELLSHIDQCPDCKSAYDALFFIASAISADLVQPPETLSKGIMLKINNRKNGSKLHRLTFGRFTAIAACIALILVGASRFGLLSSSYNSAGIESPGSAFSLAQNKESSGDVFVSGNDSDNPQAEPEEASPKFDSQIRSSDFLGNADAGGGENGFMAYGNVMENARINSLLKNEISILIFDSPEVSIYKGEHTDTDGAIRESALMLTITDKQQLEQISKLFVCSSDDQEPDQSPSFTLLVPADFSSSDRMEDLTIKVWLDGETMRFTDSKTNITRLAEVTAKAFLEFLDSISAS